MAELSDTSGVPARTIRFYIARGLVPGPLKGGRSAVYGEAHVAALSRIKQLQAKGLALSEIAAQVLDETNPPPLAPPVPWWQYGVADDVTVCVRADAAPWRLKQIRTALAELAARLKTDGQGEGDE